MAKKNPLDFSLHYIEKSFKTFGYMSFSEYSFREIFDKHKRDWHLPSNKQAKDVINYLIKKEKLTTNYFSDHDNENKKIYSWKTNDELTIIASIKSNSYYVYYTAIYLHGLTLQIPKTIYLNYEHKSQLDLNVLSILSQESIDNVFSGNQRKSSRILSFHDKKVVITNGKYTNMLGVLHRVGANQSFAFTDLERTLIDISVRPVYAGGVFEVLGAYRKAKENVDTSKMLKYLKELNYIYPYHQVIGFYLEKAGYDDKSVELFQYKIDFNFYLTYGIRNKEFSEKWKIFYPKGF